MSEIPYDNEKIIGWSKKNLGSIKTEIDALGIKHSPKSPSPVALKNAVNVSTRKRTGFVDKISYKMPRSAVFLHKGVGRGTKISQVGSTNRTAKRWFDNPTNRNFDELQQIVAATDATYVVNNLSIK